MTAYMPSLPTSIIPLNHILYNSFQQLLQIKLNIEKQLEREKKKKKIMFVLLTESCFMCSMVDLGLPFDNPKLKSSFHPDYVIYTVTTTVDCMPKLLPCLNWHMQQSSILVALIKSRCIIHSDNVFSGDQLEVDASVIYPHMIVGIKDLNVDDN